MTPEQSEAKYSEEYRLIKIKTILSDTELLLERFSGSEEMSRPFEFHVTLLSTDFNVDMKSLLRTPQIALPNVLLGRAAFPELLQREAQPKKIAQALARVLDARTSLVRACDAVDEALGPRKTPSRDVARMLRPWLE